MILRPQTNESTRKNRNQQLYNFSKHPYHSHGTAFAFPYKKQTSKPTFCLRILRKLKMIKHLKRDTDTLEKCKLLDISNFFEFEHYNQSDFVLNIRPTY